MKNTSNARFLGHIISEPLQIVRNYEPSNFDLYGDNVKPLEILEGETIRQMEERSVREANQVIAKITGKPIADDAPMDWEAWEAANDVKL